MKALVHRSSWEAYSNEERHRLIIQLFDFLRNPLLFPPAIPINIAVFGQVLFGLSLPIAGYGFLFFSNGKKSQSLFNTMQQVVNTDIDSFVA